MAEILSIRDLSEDSQLNNDVPSMPSPATASKREEGGSGVSGISLEIKDPVTSVDKTDCAADKPAFGEKANDAVPRSTSRTEDIVHAEKSEEVDQTLSENENEDAVPGPDILPWKAHKGRSSHTAAGAHIDAAVKPGEYVMRTLFAEFTIQADKKISNVMAEPMERLLSKSLQRGEDPQFDQLISAFGSVAEHCLPSLLRSLFAWFEHQGVERAPGNEHKQKGDSKRSNAPDLLEKCEEEIIMERRDLAVHFIFCLVLIEVLKQLNVHPGHEDLVFYIENLAFKHFKYREGAQNSPNAQNMMIIADLYAEVIGVLAQSRFHSVRKRFMAELKELRSRDASPATTQAIISLLMGMKFFRIKMVPIEEFEASFQFMQECGNYFLEVKDKDIKHAMAGLFVEILAPVAAIVKHEVNVPCLKNFVEMLYPPTLDLATKNKHRLALFPLVTCLLCVGQKAFFLHNWHYFLAMCLSHLKNRDPLVSRVALESLYRLLWVYMIRIKCESNSATSSRLQSIVNSLFPKGSKYVVPRDTPLNIFVKIIQFIAQERLDFAMREIVFDLLSVGRPVKFILTPERMNIGLRAFLVVADSLQKKEGEPPMPRTVGVLPSGNTMRIKKTFLNKMLTEDAAKSIGMSAYYPYVRKVFNGILRALDTQFGKPLMMTNMQNMNKEPDEMMGGERKPRIDLFRTCVAAIPRLIPDGMSRSELVELLSRTTVHIDEELRTLAFQSLQTLVIDFPGWREDVIYGFIQFLVKELPDTLPQLLDNGLRIMLQLLTSWRNALSSQAKNVQDENQNPGSKAEIANVMHAVEGLALVMLCQCRLPPRRVSAAILKEVKALLKHLDCCSKEDEPVLDVMDRFCAAVIDKCSHLLPFSEKVAQQNIDLQWLAERSSPIWTAGVAEENANKALGAAGTSVTGMDLWCSCLCSFLEKDRVTSLCPTATAHAWTIVYTRLNSLYSVVDPAPVSDNRASLLRSAATVKKPVNERDVYLHLWKNYIVFACRVVPPSTSPVQRCASPDISFSSLPDSLSSERSDSRAPSSTAVSPSALYKLIVPLLRCEITDMRDTVVSALGMINYLAIRDLMDELTAYIREAIDRKQGNVRRQRRRDTLRLQLVRIFHIIAEKGTFGKSLIDRESQPLHPVITEFIDGVRQCLEADTDRDSPSGREIRTCFASFISKLIACFPLEVRPSILKKDVRRQLFQLFAGWSGKFGRPFGWSPNSNGNKEEGISEVELISVEAMSSVLCCGPCFDKQGLAEDSSIYIWLDTLLSSKHERVYKLAQDTVVLLLEFNPDTCALLDWVVDRCYTGTDQVADGCFLALAAIFSAREYPCDHYTAIINVTLMSTGCPRSIIHETALQLLQVLDARFFGTDATLSLPACDPDSEATERCGELSTLDALLATSYSQSQMYLSRQLTQLHPELTMPMFSEITHRLQTARPSVRLLLLRYLLPWLCNMELVDPNLPAFSGPSYVSAEGARACSSAGTTGASNLNVNGTRRKEGWGSAEATEMVLNNLFYITAKFGDDCPKEIEDVWAELATCWTTNLRVILHYLFIITGLAPAELLPYTKRVVVFLGRARPDQLLDELITELQTIETMPCLVERTETPPFFRVTNLRKASSHWVDVGSDQNNQGAGATQTPSGTRTDDSTQAARLGVEKGTIHTKRHSSEDPSLLQLNCSATGKMSPRSERVRSLTEESSTPAKKVEEQNHPIVHYETSQPHPLPMPEYGGYFAPLTEFLPDASQPVNGFHRCNMAVMLLTDLIVEGLGQGTEIDWSVHLPLALHIAVLGLDHSKPLVTEHCKQLLLNLLLVLADHGDHLTMAKILLNTRTQQLYPVLTTPALPITKHTFTESDAEFDGYLNLYGQSVGSDTPAPDIVTSDEAGLQQDVNSVSVMTFSDVVKSLVDFIASRPGQNLWSYEDITSKIWNIRSAQQLDVLVQHLSRVFSESLPHSHLEERWAQVSLHLALSSPSRHYAGRSLQIFRALRVPVTSSMLIDILSRLVETAAEQGEDMQGYVTELLLTLEAAVEALETDFRPMDVIRDIFKSTPNLNNKDCSSPVPERAVAVGLTRRHAFYGRAHLSAGHAPYSHIRSTSYSATYGSKKTSADVSSSRGRNNSGTANSGSGSTLSRSRSTQSLKAADGGPSQEDKLSILAQLFWIAVCLLESDYEHEFLLALRLLERVLQRLPLDRPDCRDKVEKILPQLKWNNFPGVHAMVLKGCANVNTYEATLSVLSMLTPLLEFSVIDATLGDAFPINVMALLPYMVANYEDANELCIRSAENIAQVCNEKGKKSENLATVMTLYSRRTFSKESFQWTKCVVKYLHDSNAHLTLPMITFLVEVLERGPSNMQSAILNICHCLLHYVDFGVSTAAHQVNTELIRVVSKYIEGPHWRDSLKILKLAVTRSSSLVAPPSSGSGTSGWGAEAASHGHSSFSDSEMFVKKELPGRTMEFTFDLSQTPVIGRRHTANEGQENSEISGEDVVEGGNKTSTKDEKNPGGSSSPRRSVSLSSADSASISGWKRPWLSQGRVRESLVNLLTSCGQRVGLPKSPSWVFYVDSKTGKVIFSQSSELLEKQSSMASSMEEMSTQQDLSGDSKLDDSVTTDQQFGVFKDFDFLEYELESQDDEGMDQFNWGVHRHSLSSLNAEGEKDSNTTQATPTLSRKTPATEESSDDELGSVSPLDDAMELGSNRGDISIPPSSFPLELSLRHSPSDSSHSEYSEGDGGDVTPCNLSPGVSGLSSSTPPPFRPLGMGVRLTQQLQTHALEESDATWRTQFQSLASEGGAVQLITAINIFPKIFKDIRSRVVMATQESCQYFSRCQCDPLSPMKTLSTHFHAVLDVLSTRCEFPFICCETGSTDLSSSTNRRSWERLQFILLELCEHSENCTDKKEHALECLGLVQSTMKLQIMGETFSESTCDEQNLDLCRCLYRLHFQMLLFLESCAKLINALLNVASNNSMFDASSDLGPLRFGLYQALEEVELDPEGGNLSSSDSAADAYGAMDTKELEYTIVELLLNRRFAKVLRFCRQHRAAWKADFFGSSEDEEIASVLKIYARYLAHKKSLPIVAACPDESSLNEMSSVLMDLNLQTQSSLKSWEKTVVSLADSRSDMSDYSVRKTEC